MIPTRPFSSALALLLSVCLASSPASPQPVPEPRRLVVRVVRAHDDPVVVAAAVSGGFAAGALLLGAAGLSVRAWSVAQWNSDACFPVGQSRSQACPGTGAAARVGDSVGVASMVAGGVGLVAASVFLIARWRMPASVRVAAGPGDVGAGLEVSF